MRRRTHHHTHRPRELEIPLAVIGVNSNNASTESSSSSSSQPLDCTPIDDLVGDITSRDPKTDHVIINAHGVMKSSKAVDCLVIATRETIEEDTPEGISKTQWIETSLRFLLTVGFLVGSAVGFRAGEAVFDSEGEWEDADADADTNGNDDDDNDGVNSIGGPYTGV